MKALSIAEYQRDIAALDAASQLTTSLQYKTKRLEGMDTQTLIKLLNSSMTSCVNSPI